MINQLQHIAGSGITVDPFKLFGGQYRRTLSSAMALNLEDVMTIPHSRLGTQNAFTEKYPSLAT